MLSSPPFWLNTQSAEFRRFMHVALILALVAFAMMASPLAHADFNGNFGPESTLVTNTNNSLKGWWKAIAGWGLWLSIAGFLVSVLFLGGRWWYIPIIVMLICLFGEPAITKVASWASLTGTTGS
ncbi:hypothetical protein [Stutzerimonas stutzeri]|uniref:hypothetical protein n=1 Tax=Stutzerimonas stutzeri TaxID=316 RepID=UPI001BCA8B65|nr:hypothetical protein [Stutzerimonas stutzeri]